MRNASQQTLKLGHIRTDHATQRRLRIKQIPLERLSSISESEDECRNEAQEKETTVRISYVDCEVLELSPWILVDTFPNRMVRKIAYGTQTNPTHGPLLDKSAQNDTIEKQVSVVKATCAIPMTSSSER